MTVRRKYPKAFSRKFKILRLWKENNVAQLDVYVELEGLESELKVKKENLSLDIDFWGDMSLTVMQANQFKDGVPYLKWFYKKGYRQKGKPDYSAERKRVRYNMEKDGHAVAFFLYLADKSLCELADTVKTCKTHQRQRRAAASHRN
jgi:hypothetical protein